MSTSKPSLPIPLVVAIGLAVAFAAGVGSKAVVRRLLAPAAPAAAAAAANTVGDPYGFLRRGSETGGQAFRRKLARAAERSTKRAAPGTKVTFDEETAIEDLGPAMRGRVGYRGQVYENADDFDGVRVEGEQRQYFHTGGAVIVDAVCAPEASDCGGRHALLEATEAAVLEHLDGSGLDGLLPERGRCEVPDGGAAAALASCEFTDGVVLTVQRLTLEETRQALQGLAPGASR
jgi:hypothetical protein